MDEARFPCRARCRAAARARRCGAELQPVIVITGPPAPAAKSQAEAAGARAFVAKPYHADTLLALVHRALERRPGSGAGY